jgi:hypothetical protein
MFVAIVTAPARRVHDDLGLALVLLRVQDVVRMPWRSSSLERCSDTSTEIVPTRTGCPPRGAP